MLGIAKQGTKQMDGEKGEIVWAVRAWGSFISLPEERRKWRHPSNGRSEWERRGRDKEIVGIRKVCRLK